MKKKRNNNPLKIDPPLESAPINEDHFDFLTRMSRGPGILAPGYYYQLRNRDYPFAQYEREPNPFTDEIKKCIFQEIISRSISYAKECTDLELEIYGTRDEAHLRDKKLDQWIKEISLLLRSLKPPIGHKFRKHHFLRAFAFIPETLIRFVEEYKFAMEIYDKSNEKYSVKRTRGKKYQVGKKKDAIIRFHESISSKKYPKHMYLDDRSYEKIALSFLAGIHFECNYTELEKLYRDTKKKFTQNIPVIVSDIRKPDYFPRSLILKYMKLPSQ